MAKKFTPRLAAPSKSDRHYYSNENIFFACGYGMPNCTAYAWGRLYELTDKRYTNLCGNAEAWWGVASKAGLKTGQEPKLGAIVCYRAGNANTSSDGAGHVAVVEEIKANGDIVISNSAWKGTEFYLMTVTKASGYKYADSRQLQGFIYCGVEFEEKATSTSSATTDDYLTHTVVKGDTLWGLAVKYFGKGSKYTEIKKLNGLSNNNLTIGMKLKIPCKSAYQCIHTVVKGDTLWKLAVKYLKNGLRYSEIKKLNGLSSDTLSIGMKLKIPNK